VSRAHRPNVLVAVRRASRSSRIASSAPGGSVAAPKRSARRRDDDFVRGLHRVVAELVNAAAEAWQRVVWRMTRRRDRADHRSQGQRARGVRGACVEGVSHRRGRCSHSVMVRVRLPNVIPSAKRRGPARTGSLRVKPGSRWFWPRRPRNDMSGRGGERLSARRVVTPFVRTGLRSRRHRAPGPPVRRSRHHEHRRSHGAVAVLTTAGCGGGVSTGAVGARAPLPQRRRVRGRHDRLSAAFCRLLPLRRGSRPSLGFAFL